MYHETPDTHTGLYRRAAAFLAGKDSLPDAVKLLDEAARVLPQNREILLMQATARELAGDSESAGHLLLDVRNRWPEWYPAWTAHGIVLYLHGYPEEARQALETALALGAPEAQAGLDRAKAMPGADATRSHLMEYFVGTVLRK